MVSDSHAGRLAGCSCCLEALCIPHPQLQDGSANCLLPEKAIALIDDALYKQKLAARELTAREWSIADGIATASHANGTRSTVKTDQ